MNTEKEKGQGKSWPGLDKLTPQNRRKLIFLGILFVLGLTMMMTSQWSSHTESTSEKAAEVEQVTSSGGQEQELEERLSSILGQIRGVGRVSVRITMAAGERSEYAVNTSNVKKQQEENGTDGVSSAVSEVTAQNELVLTQNGSQPVLIQQEMPDVRGVVVVAEGADDPQVKLELVRSLQSLLDLPVHRIVVCSAKEER